MNKKTTIHGKQKVFNDRVFAEQIDVLTASTPPALASTSVVATAMGIYFWESSYILYWLAAAFIVILLRLTLYRRYILADKNFGITTWARLNTLVLCMAGCLWGSAFPLFGYGGDFDDKLVVSVMSVCAIAGGSYFSVSHLPAAIGFILCGTIPFAISMVLSVSGPEQLIGYMTLFFMLVLIRFARTFNLWFSNSTKARIAYEDQTIELGKALEKASHLSQAQSDFLANVSHEIRTPMTGLLGMLQFLQQNSNAQASPDENRQYLQVAYNSARTLQVLMNDILDMSKLQAGKFTIEPAPCELHSVVDDAVTLLRPLALEKALTLTIDYSSPEPLWLELDASRLRQIVFNLVGNAIKFTDSGSVDVKLNWKLEETDYCKIHCQITDTGPGIEESVIDTLFERFVQIDTTLSRKHTGTGLGLSICRELLELMGGSLSVASTVGQGSTFSFELVVKLTAASPLDDKLPNGISLDQRPVHLLIADDNAVNLLILEKLISNYGWTSDSATSGEQALSLFTEKPSAYDLILMDIQMPIMDGFETTRAIRSSGESGKKVPIVAVTANIYSQDMEKLQAHGINDCVAKPIDEKVLCQAIINNTRES